MSQTAKGLYVKWLEPDGLLLLEAWARDGLTLDQIAHNMGINVSTLHEYKNKFTEIDNALKKGKEVVDIEVENALYKRAIGYTITLNKQKVAKDGGVIDTAEEVHFPPDTTAQIFWLKNRKPAQWRDRVEAVQDNTDKQKEAQESLVNAIKESLK